MSKMIWGIVQDGGEAESDRVGVWHLYSKKAVLHLGGVFNARPLCGRPPVFDSKPSRALSATWPYEDKDGGICLPVTLGSESSCPKCVKIKASCKTLEQLKKERKR